MARLLPLLPPARSHHLHNQQDRPLRSRGTSASFVRRVPHPSVPALLPSRAPAHPVVDGPSAPSLRPHRQQHAVSGPSSPTTTGTSAASVRLRGGGDCELEPVESLIVAASKSWTRPCQVRAPAEQNRGKTHRRAERRGALRSAARPHTTLLSSSSSRHAS